jgi:putative restriction endonuclease
MSMTVMAGGQEFGGCAAWHGRAVWVWLERFYNLRSDKRGSHERPHRPVLLLTILDHLDHGLLDNNEIPLNGDLVRTFKRYFEVVRTT